MAEAHRPGQGGKDDENESKEDREKDDGCFKTSAVSRVVGDFSAVE